MNTKKIVLAPEFEKAVMDLGFAEFTEIQEKCIPLIQEGKDVIGLSHTGSGKTAAFGFPALEKVNPGHGIQLLVIVPTRELCTQVSKEFKKFTKYKKMLITEITGGVSINPQYDSLKKADVVVGTPGRILDHMNQRTINLSKVSILVLDEADRMFDMGFILDIKKIMSSIPKNSQKLLFSATMPPDIMEIVHKFMNNPQKVKMPVYVDKSKLMQNYYEIDKRNKFSLLIHVLKTEKPGLSIIFCGTRHFVDVVQRNLSTQGVKAQALHGGMTQNKRNYVMQSFRDGKLSVLVASDVAARGLDIKNVNMIINFDLPKTSQEYIHRIGRTARAGEEGKVITLLCHEDHDNFRKVLEDKSLLIHQLKTPPFEKVDFVRKQGRDGDEGYGRERSNNYRKPAGRFGGRSSGGGGYRGGGQGRSQRSSSYQGGSGRSQGRREEGGSLFNDT